MASLHLAIDLADLAADAASSEAARHQERGEAAASRPSRG